VISCLLRRFISVLSFYFLFINVSNAQQKSFKGLLVDTVEITSSSGYYHFDDSGTTTGIHDSYILAFSKEYNKYFTQYKRTRIKLTIQPEAEQNKQGNIRTGTFDREGLLDSLFASLTVRYRALSIEQLGLKEQEIVNLVNKKRILRIAKSYRQDWHFKPKYSTRSDREQIFQGCRNMDTLKLFLDSFRVDTTSYVWVSDYWDEMYIRIICSNKHFIFEGKYPNKLKQPWYDKSDTSVFVKTVFNFDINKYLTAITPTYFYRKKTIDAKALLNTYIVWYLKRREIVWDY
jgi:hypothetical protein